MDDAIAAIDAGVDMAGRIGAAERLVEGGCATVTQDRQTNRENCPCPTFRHVDGALTPHPPCRPHRGHLPTAQTDKRFCLGALVLSRLTNPVTSCWKLAPLFCSTQFLRQLFEFGVLLTAWTCLRCVCVLCKGRLYGCQEGYTTLSYRPMYSRVMGLSSCEDLHPCHRVGCCRA